MPAAEIVIPTRRCLSLSAARASAAAKGHLAAAAAIAATPIPDPIWRHGDGFAALRDMPSKSAALVFCDPDYGIGLPMNTRAGYKRRVENATHAVDVAGFVKSENFVDLLSHGVRVGRSLLVKWSGTTRHALAFEQRAQTFGLIVLRIVWERGHCGFAARNAGVLNNVEHFYWFSADGRARRGRPETWLLPTVWHADRVRDASRYTQHPCEMPQGLCARLVKSFTAVGERVVDVCAGSGALGLSAAMLSREYVGFDTDAEWVTQAREAWARGVPMGPAGKRARGLFTGGRG